MGEHGGVGGVHVVGRHDRRDLGWQGAEGGQEALACRCLTPALGRVQDAGAVGTRRPP